MTVATTNGEQIWAFRYSSEGTSRSLYYSTGIVALREIYPENPLFQELDVDTRLVVSEPLGELPGAWNEVPEASWGVVHRGAGDEMHTFTPRSTAA
jgi:glutamine amidotransferase